MMTSQANESFSRVQILTETVARRIAAGEVIDQPYAVVRELLDNAIDSMAKDITVNINGGGINEIRVSDNGCGMNEEDLALCWLPHATSKMTAFDDLEKITTLGFRGEALSSLAACSRLEITSSAHNVCYKVSIHGGKVREQGLSTGPPGTTVSVRELFFNMPARRKFLKSTRAESLLCRRVFLEKAAAHPGLNFRLFIDGQLKIYLPTGSFTDRVNACWPRLAPRATWWESTGLMDGVHMTIVHARPETSRKDRKYIQIYANRRRIDEYSLVHGVAYAYDEWMPGGAFPMAFVFIEIDPVLVDFNIHPAKKEARFRDLPSIRHRLVETLRDRMVAESYRKQSVMSEGTEKEGIEYNPLYRQVSGTETAEDTRLSTPQYKAASSPGISTQPRSVSHKNQAEAFVSATRELRVPRKQNQRIERFTPTPLRKNTEFRYIGQIMGVFLLAEFTGSLFVVDQHAAHERILYDRLRESNPLTERLLFPRQLNLDDAALRQLELRKEGLEKLGFVFERSDDGVWELTTLPLAARAFEDELVKIIENGGGNPEGIEKELWANLACKAAVKDNCVLDDDAAMQLLKDAFNLDNPHCPHGRPIWFEVSRNELFEIMGRTV